MRFEHARVLPVRLAREDHYQEALRQLSFHDLRGIQQILHSFRHAGTAEVEIGHRRLELVVDRLVAIAPPEIVIDGVVDRRGARWIGQAAARELRRRDDVRVAEAEDEGFEGAVGEAEDRVHARHVQPLRAEDFVRGEHDRLARELRGDPCGDRSVVRRGVDDVRAARGADRGKDRHQHEEIAPRERGCGDAMDGERAAHFQRRIAGIGGRDDLDGMAAPHELRGELAEQHFHSADVGREVLEDEEKAAQRPMVQFAVDSCSRTRAGA